MSIPRLCTEVVTTSGSTSVHSLAGKYPLHPLKCTVTEERNGEYVLEMDIENTDKYFSEIKIGRIITAPHDSTGTSERFEIYNISNQLGGIAHIEAWHISYRTQGILLKPFIVSNPTPYRIFSAFPSYLLKGGDNFISFSSDIQTVSQAAPFVVGEVKTVRSVLKDIMDTYGGELYCTDFRIQLLAQRGTESNITLRYGHNITAMTREQTNEDVFVGIYPWWKGKDQYGNETTVTLPENVLTMADLDEYFNYYKPIIPLDLSKYFNSVPSVSQLRSAAYNWLSANIPTAIPENIDVSVLQMDEEGKSSVEKLNLCDTLTILYPKMGVNVSAKVTKVVFNVLLDRYDSISIGTTGKTMNRAIKKVVGMK